MTEIQMFEDKINKAITKSLNVKATLKYEEGSETAVVTADAGEGLDALILGGVVYEYNSPKEMGEAAKGLGKFLGLMFKALRFQRDAQDLFQGLEDKGVVVEQEEVAQEQEAPAVEEVETETPIVAVDNTPNKKEDLPNAKGTKFNYTK